MKKSIIVLLVITMIVGSLFVSCKTQLEDLVIKKDKVARPGTIQVYEGEKIKIVYPGKLPDGAVIRYTIDGTDVTEKSPLYKESFELKENVKAAQIVKAKAFKKGKAVSKQCEQKYYRVTMVLNTVAAIQKEINDNFEAEGDYNYIGLDKSLTTLEACFNGLSNRKTFNGDVSQWDTSNITDLSSTFYACDKFNKPLNNWDVSNVTDMYCMFNYANKFNQPLYKWDVSNVTDMETMFGVEDDTFIDIENGVYTSFNQDISMWDTKNVTNMGRMFACNKDFNQDISGWDVSNVTNMSAMFGGAKSFNQDISGWDVSKVEHMTNMFKNSKAFDQNISSWEPRSLINAESMFSLSEKFNQDLTSWEEKLPNKAIAYTGIIKDAKLMTADKLPAKLKK